MARKLLGAVVAFAVGIAVALAIGLRPDGRLFDLLYELIHTPGFVVGVVAALYLGFVLIARWFLIAKPVRAGLRGDYLNVKTRLELANLRDQDSAPIKALLEGVDTTLNDHSLSLVLLWGLGQEVEVLNRISIADSLLARFLPEPEVEVRLLVAHAALSDQASPQSKALADRIKTVQAAKGAEKPSEAYQKALLEQALIADYHADPIGGDLTWHRKTIWLVITGLILITTAAAALNHWELLLMGAAGAFLSRLWRAVRSTKAPVAYWSYWVTLMLAPVAGAFAAFGGVLLIHLLQDAKVLGDAAKSIDWNSPKAPATLGVAFLLGFSERLFDRLAGEAEKAIEPANSSPEAPDGPQVANGAPPAEGNAATSAAVKVAGEKAASQAAEAQPKPPPEPNQGQDGGNL